MKEGISKLSMMACSFAIIIPDGFPTVMLEHGVYTKEKYIKLQEREDKYWKDKGSEVGIKDIIPEEIATVRFHLSPEK
jgi:hypothetical protein